MGHVTAVAYGMGRLGDEIGAREARPDAADLDALSGPQIRQADGGRLGGDHLLELVGEDGERAALRLFRREHRLVGHPRPARPAGVAGQARGPGRGGFGCWYLRRGPSVRFSTWS